MLRYFLSILLFIFLIGSGADAFGCTSMVVGAKASASGRPLLWKHRDTGADNNFIARVEATDSTFGYVALYNAGDSALVEAWMGMNDVGFAVMNTASYNLMPDTATFKDQEAVVMSAALARCTTVADFERLLDEWPKPRGVQANFGVIDAAGGAAYFETDDYDFVRFDATDSCDNVLVRTNFSVSGDPDAGSGYIRFNTATALVAGDVARHAVTPASLTEGLSRSLYHSLQDIDYADPQWHIVANRDFIPRDISTASIVIEGIAPGDDVDSTKMIMWTVLGYPPCAPVVRVTADSIPEGYGATSPEWRSRACDEAMMLRRSTFPFQKGSGPSYIDLDRLRPIIKEMHMRSMDVYGKD